MYKEILYQKQIDKLNILKMFNDKFYLAGGTAIALQLGHRKSIYFDLFSNKPIYNTKILNKFKKQAYSIDRILVDNKGEELTLILGGVKFIFKSFKKNTSKTQKVKLFFL